MHYSNSKLIAINHINNHFHMNVLLNYYSRIPIQARQLQAGSVTALIHKTPIPRRTQMSPLISAVCVAYPGVEIYLRYQFPSKTCCHYSSLVRTHAHGKYVSRSDWCNLAFIIINMSLGGPGP